MMSIMAIVQKLRQRALIKPVYVPEHISWNIGDVVKVMILFVFFSMGTGMALGIINQFVFHKEVIP